MMKIMRGPRCFNIATTSFFMLLVITTTTLCCQAQITGPSCGPPGSVISIAGSTSVLPLAQVWADAYRQVCNASTTSVTTISASNSTVGAKRVCAVASAGSAVDIGMLSRPILSTVEANVTDAYNYINATKNEFTYKCAQGNSPTRSLIQVDVAIEGATVAMKLDGIASKCIASLPGGGLTLDQLRWIYSKYVFARLLSTGLSPTAVPKTDGNETTHLWSELGGAHCPATEIVIAGSPPGSEILALVVQTVLTDNAHGETIATGRYVGYYSDPNDNPLNLVSFLNTNSDAIGFFPTSYLNANHFIGSLTVASLKGPDASFYAPSVTTLSNGMYPLARRLYMEVRSDDPSVLAKVRPFFALGYSKIGTARVVSTGLAPISTADQLLMLSRLRAPGGVDLNSIRCTLGFYVVIDGSAALYPLVQILSSLYAAACGTQFVISANGDAIGAARLCSNSSLDISDVAMADRSISLLAPVTISTYFPYGLRCPPTGGYIRQVPVVFDAITVSFASGGISAKCIGSLPGGGLTVDQIRWIYSSYTRAQLIANEWDTASVPNSDANDATHLWSELGGADCPTREIRIAGPPNNSSLVQFLARAVFTGVNETVASNRPYGYVNALQGKHNGATVIKYLVAYNDAVGLLRFADYNNNFGVVSVAPVRNSTGKYVTPTESAINSGGYSPLSQTFYMDLRLIVSSFFTTSFMIQFGYDNDFIVRTAGFVPLSQAAKAAAGKTDLRNPFMCFSEMSTVDVLDRGLISIKELKIGDMVKNAQGKFDQVYCLGHYAPDMVTKFVQIHFTNSRTGMVKPLEMTPEHMLFANGAAIPASGVSVGDLVKLVNKGGHDDISTDLVQSVKWIVRRGAYGPLTMSGTIAVNNVACSTYIDLQSDSGFLTMGANKTPLTMQFLAHMFQATHRLVCKVSLAYCKAETYDEQGLSTRLAAPVAAGKWFFKQNNALVMMAVFVPVCLLGIVMFAVEAVFDNAFLVLLALVSCLMVVNRRSHKKL